MRVDVVLIGIFLTATAAGIYNVVLLIVALAAIPLAAFNQMMPPVASDLHSNGQTETLDAVYTTVVRLIVSAGTVIGLTLPGRGVRRERFRGTKISHEGVILQIERVEG